MAESKKKQSKKPPDRSKSPTPKGSEPPVSWKNPKYKPDMCERIQPWYAEGKSDVQIAHRLDICRETFYEWVRTYPEFAKAVRRGKAAAQEWWENLGQNMAKGELKGSEKVWALSMKNRFRYADRVEVEDCNHLGLNNTIKDLKALVELYKSKEKEY